MLTCRLGWVVATTASWSRWLLLAILSSRQSCRQLIAPLSNAEVLCIDHGMLSPNPGAYGMPFCPLAGVNSCPDADPVSCHHS